jgi:hypothetical protein
MLDSRITVADPLMVIVAPTAAVQGIVWVRTKFTELSAKWWGPAVNV